MERQGAGGDTEECVSAQHFDVPILEVEGFMRGYGRRVDERLVIGNTCRRGIDGRLVIRGVCDYEVGQSGDADGGGMDDGSGGRCRDWVCLFDGDRFGWRRLKNIGFEVLVRESERCGNGSCGGVLFAFVSRFWLPGIEYRWGRKALPATLP